jgi:hypothetical protein
MKIIKKQFLLLPLIFLFLLTSSAFAQISIEKRTGNLSVTTAEGDLFTVSTSDNLPPLASGSVVEVLSGDAEFRLGGTSILTVVAGESVMNLISGNQVAVNVNNDGVETQIHALTGDLQVSIGEAILAVKSPAELKANISDGKATILVVKGEAAIVEFAGTLKKLTPGTAYPLGSVAPTFSEEMDEEMEEPEPIAPEAEPAAP